MPVSGLVLTLSTDTLKRESALAALRRHRCIEIGQASEHRLPIAVDTPDSDADRQVWSWLHELPGVEFVDLVCADSGADSGTDAPAGAAQVKGER